MSGPRPSVLFLSSNIRRRYAEDILTALALPRGALVQFRYEAKYVVPALQQSIANGAIVGQLALVAFVADVQSDGPFLVPVRYAEVAEAEAVADMFVFRLRVEGYTDLDDLPLSEAGIRDESRRFVDRLAEANGGQYYPATGRFPDLGLRHPDGDAPRHWLGVARRLAQHPTFAHSYFIRVDDPVLDQGKAIPFDEQGRLALSDRRAARLRVAYFTEGYPEEGTKVLSCATDGTFLRISSADAYRVALRYDSVEFWLQPTVISFDALARVTVGFSFAEPGSWPGREPLTITAGFPVVVRRSRARMLTRVGASATGAFLVALPAILGAGFPLTVRTLFAVMGALLLSVSTIVIARGER